MKKKFIVLVVIMILTNIINNMAHPVTPDKVQELGQGAAFYGIIFGAMALANFLMSPIWGRLSDQHGRKIFMVIAPIGYAFAQLGFGFSTNLVMIVVFRMLAGMIASATFIAGMAYLIDITTLKNRSKLMVFFTAITRFGANLGYLLGGYIGMNNFRTTFVLQAVLSILMSVFIFFIMKENYEKKAKSIQTNIVQDLKKYKKTIVPYLLMIVIFTSTVFKGFDIGFNSYMKFDLDFNSFEIGIAMAIVGLVGLFTNFLIFPIIKRYFNDLKLLIMSIIVMAASAVIFTQISELKFQLIVLIFFFAGLALYKPLLQSILSKAGDRNGEVMGLNNAAHALGMVIGSVGIGYIYKIQTELAFYTLSGIAFMSAILLILRKRQIEPYTKENLNEENN